LSYSWASFVRCYPTDITICAAALLTGMWSTSTLRLSTERLHENFEAGDRIRTYDWLIRNFTPRGGGVRQEKHLDERRFGGTF